MVAQQVARSRQRRFFAALQAVRCIESVELRDGSLAQCTRIARYGNRCWQHGGKCRLVAEPISAQEVLAYLLRHPKIITERGARRALERERGCVCSSCSRRGRS